MRFPKPERRGPKPRKPIRRSRRPAALSRYGRLQELTDAYARVACRAEHALGVAARRRGEANAAGCELCGAFAGDAFLSSPASLQWAHGITRGAHAIRYHSDNTFALCSACHMLYTYSRREEWPDVVQRLIGHEGWMRLLAARNAKRASVDLQLVVLECRQRVERLPEHPIKTWALERLRAADEHYARTA